MAHYKHYELDRFVIDYQKDDPKTQKEFTDFLQKEILSILQNYVKRPKQELEKKVDEYKDKLLSAIKKGEYKDSEKFKTRLSQKITPLARSYAAELKKAMTTPKIIKEREDGSPVTSENNEKKNTDEDESLPIPLLQGHTNREEPIGELIPRPYQIDAVDAMKKFVDSWIANDHKDINGLINSAFLLHQTMGTGKTVEIGMFIERFATQVLPRVSPGEKLRIMVQANKIGTIQHQYRTLFHGGDDMPQVLSPAFADQFYVQEFHSSASRNTQTARLSKGKKIENHHLMILSTHQSAGDPRIQKIVDKHGPFHIVWIDEGHHLPAHEFKKAAMMYLTQHKNGLISLMPVTTGTSTATLESIVGKPIFEYTLPMYLASEYAPYVDYTIILRQDLSEADIQIIHQRIIEAQSEPSLQKKYKRTNNLIADIDKLFPQFASMDALVDDILTRVDDLNGTIYYCPSIAFAEELTETLNKRVGDKFPARSYHSDDRYSDAFECFRKKEIAQIVTIDMLNESIHLPHINNAILLRKTDSGIIYHQQFGRSLTGKHSKILDYTGSFRNFMTAHEIANQAENYRKSAKIKNSTNTKSRFSIIATQATGNIVGASSSMGLDLLSAMRSIYELKSGVEYRKASKENIIKLRQDGILKDDDCKHHTYPVKAKKINEAYDTHGFLIPESMNGLISVLGGNIAFDTSHEYVMALLQGKDFVRGKPFVTSEQFIEYVKKGTIPKDVLYESKRTDFALAKNATEELPCKLYVKFRHLCQMMMDIGRNGKYSTEMFHEFINTGKKPDHLPFANLNDYQQLYKEGKITLEDLRYENRKTFAENFNATHAKTFKKKLYENRSSIRDMAGYNDWKYVQKVIMGENIKRDPTKAELIQAWRDGDITSTSLDRKNRPAHAQLLNTKYKDNEDHHFTFPLTFDAFIKIMEDGKYKTRYDLHGTYSYPKSYVKTLFDGGDYEKPIPKATQSDYAALVQQGIIKQDMLTQFTWSRFARARNKIYSKQQGFALHEAYQSTIANMTASDDRKGSRSQEEYRADLDIFFATNKPTEKKLPASPTAVLGGNFSASAVIKMKREEMIQTLRKNAVKAESDGNKAEALAYRHSLQSLEPKNQEYKDKIKLLKQENTKKEKK